MAFYIPQILGQVKPTLTVDTLLFTVTPGNTVQFSVFICNQSSAYDNYSIALVPYGTVEMPSSYLAYNTALAGGGTVAFSGLYLNGGDSVYVQSTLGNCGFTATGIDFLP